MSKEGVPIDFFSWHIYTSIPKKLEELSVIFRGMLDKYGYKKTESILNEWNYVDDWEEGFIDSIKTIIGIKGAAFSAACMCLCQDTPTDMLMYYDARPCAFNGLFDFYTLGTLKGYYPFKLFNKLYRMGNQVECKNSVDDIYITGAANNEKGALMIVYYTNEDNQPSKKLSIDIKGMDAKSVECLLLDETHDAEPVDAENRDGVIDLSMNPNTLVFLKLKK